MHKNIYYFLTTSSECHYFVLQIIVLLTRYCYISDTRLRVRSYHFILIDIELDKGMVTVMDSLRKDISEYIEIKNSFAR
jgi:hypothetical protein